MANTKTYGDEILNYGVLAKDMSPKKAREYLDTNINDGIYMLMPDKRRIALHIRANEK